MTDILRTSRPTPKRLILSLLSAPGLATIEVGHLIQWAQLFSIDPAATRVAVGRLVKQGFITALGRGSYAIGPHGRQMAQTASHWIDAEDRVGAWNEGWLVVHTSHLGRTNKTALRARERAFRLNGFAELVSGLWCRPDNLVQTVNQTRGTLVELGLESEAVVMRVSDIPGMDSSRLFRLWPRDQLEAGYRETIEAMRNSVQRLDGMTQNEAARETFLVGEAVIRRINEDPLLPDQMVAADARREMIRQMVKYNQIGRTAWEDFGTSLQP